LKSKDAAFLQRWKAERAGGRWRYILISGVLTWGTPMFVVTTFFGSRSAQLTAGTVVAEAIIWVFAGLLFGTIVWFLSERRYARLSSVEGRHNDGQVV
jgi:hypothetical protein